MLGRREFMCGCSAAALFGGTLSGLAQGATRVGYPCGIVPGDFRALENGARLHSVGKLGSALPLEEKHNFKLVNSSKNVAFESVLGEVLVDIAHEFSIFPDFRYYEDFGDPNALAAPDRLRQHANKSDGTVLLGVEFFLNAIRVQNGDSGILAVCAHEFAHIAAFKRQLMAQLYRSRLKEFAFELHADFLAGFFLRKHEARFPGFNVAGVIPLWKNFGSPKFNAPGTHGTTDMRKDAINAGYFLVVNNPGTGFDQAYSAATQHVSRYRK